MAVIQSLQAGTVVEISKNTLAQPYLGVVPLVTGSGNQANAEAKATLTGTAQTIVYLCGFAVTGAGAATPKVVIVTVEGILGGTRSFIYAFADDPKKANPSLVFEFVHPIPGAGVGVPIVITCPAGGTGSTNNMVFAHGFYSLPSLPSVI